MNSDKNVLIDLNHEQLEDYLSKHDFTDNKKLADFLINKNCPENLLYLYSENSEYQKYIAQNPNCPKGLFEKFSKSNSISVRMALVSNENCPEELLEKIIDSNDLLIVKVELVNNCRSIDFLRKILEKQKQKTDIKERILKDIISHKIKEMESV